MDQNEYLGDMKTSMQILTDFLLSLNWLFVLFA